MKTVTLPSGAELDIDLAPFSDARSLYQAVLEEMKVLQIKGQDEIDYNMLKDIFCAGLSSKKIEAAIEKCMNRATYNKVRISYSTWEAHEARQDYIEACFEVAKENILPFAKSLMQGLGPLAQKIIGDLASRPAETAKQP